MYILIIRFEELIRPTSLPAILPARDSFDCIADFDFLELLGDVQIPEVFAYGRTSRRAICGRKEASRRSSSGVSTITRGTGSDEYVEIDDSPTAAMKSRSEAAQTDQAGDGGRGGRGMWRRWRWIGDRPDC